MKLRLPITDLRPLFSHLPAEFCLTVCDVGSIGGLHRRWNHIRPHLATVGFDPLDPKPSVGRERIFPYLIGDREGAGTLFVTSRSSMSSTLVPNTRFFAPFWNKAEDVEIIERIEAQMVTLDRIMEQENVRPDAIKIDVQGGEAGVIAGATKMFSQSILLAEIECSFAERYEGQQTFDQVMAQMRMLGFALLDIRRLKRYRFRNKSHVVDPSLGNGRRSGRLAFCDAIFMLETDRLFDRVENCSDAALKSIVLALTYGKVDLASALFDLSEAKLPPHTREGFARFFHSMAGDGGWIQRLHHRFDRWAKRV